MKQTSRKGTTHPQKGAASGDTPFWGHLHMVLTLMDRPAFRPLGGYVRARRLDLLEVALGELIQRALQAGDVDLYYDCVSVRAVYSKYEGCASPEGEAVALRAWHKAERYCKRANRRLALTERGLIGTQYIGILEKARKIVARVLGDFSFTEMVSVARHGPGVALGLAGLATSGAFKYASGSYTVSQACALLFRDAVLTDRTWDQLVTKNRTKLEVVGDHDKISFVPKNWKTRRSIGVGPIGNLYLQLGIGEMIVNRLKRVGIDLSDQSNNQRAALSASRHEGSYGDAYVTLDLSMASDTLCRQLVKLLVPDQWFRVLNCTRTQWAMLPNGDMVWLQKFSAMGNGFTFPLETLVFYALAQAVMSETAHHNKIWVYGDDIIVPRGSSLLLTEVLRWCGFSVNTEKSYYHGDFYESCGADYFGGVPVRPVYWKRTLRSDRDYYVLVNAYAGRLPTLCSYKWTDGVRARLILSCRDPVLYGPPLKAGSDDPENIPDDRIVEADRSLWSLTQRHGVLYCKVYRSSPRNKRVNDDWAYLQARHALVRKPSGTLTRTRAGREASVGAVEAFAGVRSGLGQPVIGSDFHYVPIRKVTSGTRRISVS